jgi:hypothetical protein
MTTKLRCLMTCRVCCETMTPETEPQDYAYATVYGENEYPICPICGSEMLFAAHYVDEEGEVQRRKWERVD